MKALLSVQVILWTLDNGNTINSLELDNSNSECYYFERLERVLATQVLALSNPSTGVTGSPSHFEAAASGLGNQTNPIPVSSPLTQLLAIHPIIHFSLGVKIIILINADLFAFFFGA